MKLAYLLFLFIVFGSSVSIAQSILTNPAVSPSGELQAPSQDQRQDQAQENDLTLEEKNVQPAPQAANSPPKGEGQPLEITADESLEWDRAQKRFIANDNAMAQQGDVSIAANKLTADYEETQASNFDIHTLKAFDNVVIRSGEANVYGDLATYDVKGGKAEVTGQNLRMVSEQNTLTARDKFEYWTVEGVFRATGTPQIITVDKQGKRTTLDAGVINARLVENKAGKRVLEIVEAQPGVIIRTPTEILTGDYGIYTASTNIAELRGNVRITRGPNVLEGERAQVDLNTNISQMFGGLQAGSDGRVRGVFYPGSQ